MATSQQGQLFVNDKPVTRIALKEVPAGAACGGEVGAKVKRWRETMPNGASFALGDNRDNSTDSRMISAMGFIPMDNLVGKVTRIFWSLDANGRLRGERMRKVW